MNKIIYLTIIFLFLFLNISYGNISNNYYNQKYNLTKVDSYNSSEMVEYGYDISDNRILYQSSGYNPISIEIIDIDGFSFSVDQVQISFVCPEDNVGNVSYEFAVGTTTGATDALYWTPFDVDSNCSAILTGLSLVSGQDYYVSVRIKNFADDIVSEVTTSNAITVYDPSSDEDGDTFDNQSELLAESDPFNINSFPGLTQINLVPGFNLISIPADTSKKPDLLDWLPVVGTITEVSKVMIKGEGEAVYSSFIPENISNPSYSLYGDEGLLVYANEQKTITFNSILCLPHNLRSGFNFVGFSCVPEGYSAYQLLTDLGSGFATSVQKYSVEKGSFETAAFKDIIDPAGVDFPIERGVGYFIYMQNDLFGFTP